MMNAACGECGRIFDLTNPVDILEWAAGHDCEAPVEVDDEDDRAAFEAINRRHAERLEAIERRRTR
jgi:hypothetical protein